VERIEKSLVFPQDEERSWKGCEEGGQKTQETLETKLAEEGRKEKERRTTSLKGR